MKLNAQQAQHVASQLRAHAIPDEHPTTPQLKEAIGDHTFFLNDQGLHVVEPGATDGRSEASALKIASWSEEQEGQLFLHEPQEAQAVTLGPAGSED
jgi:hypothetical protein